MAMATGEQGSTGGPADQLADTARELLELAVRLRSSTLGELPAELQRLARRNPALLVVSSLSLGLNLARSSSPESERPHDRGHGPAHHAEPTSEGKDQHLSSDEPVEAPGRLGDLRHLGSPLHDKVGEVGQGQPENHAQQTAIHPPPQRPSSELPKAGPLRLKEAQPLLVGALGLAAGALLAMLLPAEELSGQPQDPAETRDA